jgi:hypothetical protein
VDRRLREDVTRSIPRSVDAANCVIRGVRLCGRESHNGRRYTSECFRDAVERGLYEGRSLRTNHRRRRQLEAGEDPDVADVLGVVQNVVQGPDGCPYGDLILLPSHPMTPRVLEAAQRGVGGPLRPVGGETGGPRARRPVSHRLTRHPGARTAFGTGTVKGLRIGTCSNMCRFPDPSLR